MAEQIVVLQQMTAPSDERLEELERSRALWEVNMQALVLEAKGSYQAAANAESRARTMKRHHENADPFDTESPEGAEAEAVHLHHAPASEEESLHAMRLDVAPDHKAIALRYKFS